MKDIMCNINRRYAGLLAVLTLFAVIPAMYGHAPSNIELVYNADSEILEVSIVHDVSDPATHYIYRIEVRKNGTVFSEEYKDQPTSSEFTYTYQLSAAPGDMIEVAASCNLGGSITGTLQVGSGSSQGETEAPALWPVHAVFMTSGLFLMLWAVYSVISKAPKTWWLKAHKAVGVLGTVLVVSGLIAAVYMVSETGGPHLRVNHAYGGILTLLFVISSPLLGYVALNWKTHRQPVRKMHVWISRITLVLLVITLVSGMLQAGLL